MRGVDRLSGPLTLALGCAFFTSAAPVAAQTDVALLCGDYAARSWVNGTAEESDVSTAADPLRLSLSLGTGATTVTAFRVSAEAEETLRIEAAPTGPRGDGDPKVRLLDSEGNIFGENDDAGEGTLNARVETPLEPGDYCVIVDAVGEYGMAMGELQIARASQPALFDLPDPATLGAEDGGGNSNIPACTADTQAGLLIEGDLNMALDNAGRAGTPVQQQVNLTGTEAYLRFTLDAPAALTLRAQNTALDPVMALFDAEGRQLGYNDDDRDSLNARLDMMEPLPAGEYCIGVRSIGHEPGAVTVSVDAFDEVAMLREAYDRAEMAPPMDGSVAIQAVEADTRAETTILVGKSARWFSFDVERRAAYAINAIGGGVSDPRLRLFNAQGVAVGDVDDSNDSLDAEMVVVLAPGKYRLAVMNSSSDGAFAARPVQLSFERFLPVE
ncbi:MAG: hypothetical protein Q4G24_14060 [Paracoccus sp. (in: a-proteobacteria)]|uniref:hypothetical protein n=1 Tax=Paracoccus sp. TaxID=267 RepID=UPI0026E0F0B2|nr:hypothetical protein [Paracoccus sp. (in: a-proteobacteria)]MDO5622581.1 hypothetical protein [Paracoccus sp. (in: a-proteobacteria)]